VAAFGKIEFSADRRRGHRVVDQCNSSIDQCRIWLGLRMPPALGTTLATSRRCGALVQEGAIVSPNLKPQSIAVEHKTRGTSMDTVSIVIAHPALAGRRGPIAGSRHLPHRSPAAAGAMRVALSRAEITSQPNPLDSAAQSYEGGAVAALDFTPEVERPKAARSTCPTTT
jgi:hypothetical protein